MNPIVFALRHPITTMMLVVALVGGGALAVTRMRIDIFPPINQPQIFVFVNYGGYDPGQMEGLLVSQFELYVTAQNGYSETFNATFFVATALGYLAITLPLIGAVNKVEKKLHSGLVGIAGGL